MKNENQDLLDLCTLNQMEENIKDSSAVDRDETLRAIDWKKRQLVERIKQNSPPVAPDAMKKHREENTVNGKYLSDIDE